MAKELIFTATYNERTNIGWWIEEVAKARPSSDILIVDDNSPDGTGELISEMSIEFPQITLHSRVGKLGLSSAHLYALQYAYENDYDVLVTMDADGQHDPADLDKLLAGLSEADIVVGTRFHPDSMYFIGGPRRWAMVLLSKALSSMAKTQISDSTSGFRSAGPRAIDLFAVNYPADYLGDTVGSLSIAIRNGLVIREAPVTMYFRAVGRPSKNALWSALYLGRATLALMATLLARRSQGKGDQT